MSTLLICLFIAAILPYIAKLPAAYAMSKAKGGYNNNYPRDQQARLEGFGARAVAAHQNSFESLLLFSTAVLAAIATNHVTHTVEMLAIAYIISRLVYHLVYLLNLATLRSSVWFVGYICCLTILWMCIP